MPSRSDPMGLVGAATGSSVGDFLQQMIADRLKKEALAEELRKQQVLEQQAQERIDIDRQQVVSSEGLRRAQLAETARAKQEAETNADRQREEKKLELFRPNQVVSMPQYERSKELGYADYYGPHEGHTEGEDPSTHTMRFLGTAKTEDQEARRQAAEDRAKVQQDLAEQRISLAEANTRIAEINANTQRMFANRPRVRQFNTKNERGEAVIQVKDVDSGEVLDEMPMAPTAQMQNMGASMGKAMPVIRRLSELSEVINTRYGPEAKVHGWAKTLAAKANLDDDVALYQSTLEGFIPLVSRAVGHTGVLTQQDVEGTMKLFPGPPDSKTLRDRKVANLNDILGQVVTEGGAPTPTGATAPTATPPKPGAPRERKWRRVG